ncbi:hypothetical protein C8Q77DRAFT_284680 [Trametes polyzona]|nr:hypothetical protein C8Q77DRAFT_284680 [Trametes polyzona]
MTTPPRSSADEGQDADIVCTALVPYRTSLGFPRSPPLTGTSPMTLCAHSVTRHRIRGHSCIRTPTVGGGFRLRPRQLSLHRYPQHDARPSSAIDQHPALQMDVGSYRWYRGQQQPAVLVTRAALAVRRPVAFPRLQEADDQGTSRGIVHQARRHPFQAYAVVDAWRQRADVQCPGECESPGSYSPDLLRPHLPSGDITFRAFTSARHAPAV